MKKYFKYLAITALTLGMAACADTDGDGEGEFTWEGSQNPENTSYRNPVWEPSLAGGTVFKAASNFVAISQETQWAAGLDYACPSLQSSNMMNWSSNQQAFSYPEVTDKIDEETGEPIVNPGSYPEWLTGKITHVSADFARTIAGANYWMVYGSEDDNAFGAASASSGMGPYTDQGCFLKAEDLGVESLRYPHLSVFVTNYYLGYTTENGSYLQQLNLRRGQVPALRGAAVKVAPAEFYNICVYRVSNTDYYMFGTVKTGSGSEIRYGRSTKATGPFVDKNGVELTDGASKGELLVEGGTEYEAPCNPMRLVMDESGVYFLAYNATAIGNEFMPSGFKRQPLFVNPLEMDEEGWFTKVVVPQSGWTSPRFQ